MGPDRLDTGAGPALSPEIYVDADACPVKEEILRVAGRHGLAVHLVSNGGIRLYGLDVQLDAAPPPDWHRLQRDQVIHFRPGRLAGQGAAGLLPSSSAWGLKSQSRASSGS